MLWRKFKLDWTYAVGELVIVTLGVLVALGMQQWNEVRLERVEEKEILSRLLVDLETDLHNLENMYAAVSEKEKSLDRLNATFISGERPSDSPQFYQDLVMGANYGWNQPNARSRTFEEILSSGKFGLIRSADLRGVISDYYANFDSLHTRTDARETEYPTLSYRLVPRSRQSAREDILLADDTDGILLAAETDLARQQLDQIVTNVLNSDLRNFVIAERNLARFILRVSEVVRAQRQRLAQRIETYRESLDD